MLKNLTSWLSRYIKKEVMDRMQLSLSQGMAARFYKHFDHPEMAAQILQSQRYRSVLKSVELDAPQGERILILAPHQDDETLGAGGTLIKCRQKGKMVQVAYVTDGSAGTSEYNKDKEVRYEEAKRVWKTIGGEAPIFMDIPCRKVEPRGELIHQMKEVLISKPYDTVFLPFILESPKDHRNTCELFLKACEDLSISPDLEIWSYQVTSMLFPNVVVDITGTIDQKDRINDMWVSQNKGFNYSHMSRGLAAYNTLFKPAAHSPLPKREYVEVFWMANLEDYRKILEPFLSKP